MTVVQLPIAVFDPKGLSVDRSVLEALALKYWDNQKKASHPPSPSSLRLEVVVYSVVVVCSSVPKCLKEKSIWIEVGDFLLKNN